MSYFLPLEVVDRGSETQLQVGENLNAITWLVKGYIKSVPIARTAGTKYLFKHQHLRMFGLKLDKCELFSPT